MQNEQNKPADVRELQDYLRRLAVNYPRLPVLAADGIFGPETREAVTSFQVLFGLPPTGEADGDTWAALREEYRRLTYPKTPPRELRPFQAGEPFVQVGDSGNTVFLLQVLLNTLAEGYVNLLRVTVNGLFDSETERALQKLQEVFGIEPHGRLDRRTWDRAAALYNDYAAR